MYKITVIRHRAVQAIYYAYSREQGLANAKAQHSTKCKFIVEDLTND